LIQEIVKIIFHSLVTVGRRFKINQKKKAARAHYVTKFHHIKRIISEYNNTSNTDIIILMQPDAEHFGNRSSSLSSFQLRVIFEKIILTKQRFVLSVVCGSTAAETILIFDQFLIEFS
jgi:hypothetical protein